ncbi:MAG: 1-acyl-sn-glycerol-3-phosphate acyltransferase [Cellvibrionaceae bacterium]|nr:1-acyl-sn-glycerol-3-phosphate acyltransferase [Cellvibrionaceae bacterium]
MNQFDDIRPYNDSEVVPTIQRLLSDGEFVRTIARFRFPQMPACLLSLVCPLLKGYLSRQSRKIQSVQDLQTVIAGYVQRMLAASSAGMTLSGLEHLCADKAYLFISNHRDIVVDPALVNWALYQQGHSTLQIAIGDNLLTKPFVSDLMRLNKSFIVNRSATKPREKLTAAKHLSAYIHYAIVNQGANVWIAQREGRAKDGIDRTNSAVIRMLTLNKPKHLSLADYVKQLNIVPVSLSYEYDPCDYAKARELYLQQSQGGYEKAEHEDAASIAKGITGFKGRIHVAFGQPLDAGSCCESTASIVAALDKNIIANYVLQPSNCIAYEELHGTLPEGIAVSHQQLPFEAASFTLEKQQFHQRLLDCPAAYRELWLSMYANPIISQQSQRD